MAVKSRSNSHIMPPNSRSVDVARQAIRDIVPVQQQKSLNAFRVNGYNGVLYTKLTSGKPCSCSSGEHLIRSRLTQDGHASEGLIDELLMGSGFFDSRPYSFINPDNPSDTTPSNLKGDFESADNLAFSFGMTDNQHDIVGDFGVGSNGSISNPNHLIDLNGTPDTTFDNAFYGVTDSPCPVCFGSRFVGGFTPLGATRLVLPVQDWDLNGAEILHTLKPWKAAACTATTQITLPRGALAVDALKVYNGFNPIPYTLTVDGASINTNTAILKYCDGKQHTLSLTTTQEWTHMELQFATTAESIHYALPRLSRSGDLSFLERLEPFAMEVSCAAPQIGTSDVIVDTAHGKVFVVQTANPFYANNRNVLRWDVNVRPIQPRESYRILPQRGRVPTNQPSANPTLTNRNGRFTT